MVRSHLFTCLFWKDIFKRCYIEENENNSIFNEFEFNLKKKKNSELLKDSNYMFYKYWYPYFYKKTLKRDYSDYAKLYKNVTDIQSFIVGKLINIYLYEYTSIITSKRLFLEKKKRKSNILSNYAYFYSFKLSKLNSKNFISIEDYHIIVLDLRFKKPKLYSMYNSKCVFSISAGMVLKQIKVKEKNFKKHQRTLNVMVKSSINKIVNSSNNEKVILQIRGVKSMFFKLIVFLKKIIDFNKIILVFSPSISRGKIRLKRVKAIKRNLRKKQAKI